METKSPNEKFYEIEDKLPSLVSRAKSMTMIVLVQVVIGIICIYSADLETRWLVNIGYGLFVSAICTPLSTACQILANILKIQVIAYKTTNHIPDNSRKKEQEENVPQHSNAVYIGGIKLEDE